MRRLLLFLGACGAAGSPHVVRGETSVTDNCAAADVYREHSPVFWADKLQVPVLILHSRQDRLVPVDHALKMAAALQANGKSFALHIYDHDGHSLPLNRDDRNRQIVEWFMSVK